MFQYKIGFTLAEVLTVIGIIGMIANMTIPTLIENISYQETTARVKKFYSAATQAFVLAETETGPANTWGWGGYDSATGAMNAMNIMGPYFKISKNCGTSTGCYPNVIYKLLNNTNNFNFDSTNFFAKAVLADGTLITFVARNDTCGDTRGSSNALQNLCGFIYADVNGFKKPNQYGRDLFGFYITKYGVIPIGTSFETTYPPTNCNKTLTGYACTAWVIEKGNMDYLN